MSSQTGTEDQEDLPLELELEEDDYSSMWQTTTVKRSVDGIDIGEVQSTAPESISIKETKFRTGEDSKSDEEHQQNENINKEQEVLCTKGEDLLNKLEEDLKHSEEDLDKREEENVKVKQEKDKEESVSNAVEQEVDQNKQKEDVNGQEQNQCAGNNSRHIIGIALLVLLLAIVIKYIYSSFHD